MVEQKVTKNLHAHLIMTMVESGASDEVIELYQTQAHNVLGLRQDPL
jgi:hypothetical protein